MLNVLQKKYPGAHAWSFGDSPDMANALAELVVKGIKTATSCAYSEYVQEGRPFSVGDYHIILDGNETPVCVIRVIRHTLFTFDSVGKDFAYKEGEGDRSLAYWREEHRRFFESMEITNSAGESASAFSPTMEILGEEFVVVEQLS